LFSLDLTEYFCGHHEKWDSTDYPRGLKGAQIPRLSRIISVVEICDRVLHSSELPLNDRGVAAIKIIKQGGGTQVDPQITEILLHIL